MTQQSALVFLDDMLEALQQIEHYVHGLDFTQFSQNRLVIDGVIRNIPDEMKNSAEDIPWNNIIGLRNVLIHEYFGVDLTIVWEIITKDLPPMKGKIQALVQCLEKTS